MSDDEKRAARMAEESLSYSRASFFITFAQFLATVATGAIGLYIGVSGTARDPISLIAILVFLYLVLTSGLILSRPRTKTMGLDIPDFIRRINSLGRLQVLALQITDGMKDKENSTMIRTYKDTVNYLYMMALAGGRKDLADELLRLYSLDKQEAANV